MSKKEQKLDRYPSNQGDAVILNGKGSSNWLAVCLF